MPAALPVRRFSTLWEGSKWKKELTLKRNSPYVQRNPGDEKRKVIKTQPTFFVW